MNKVDEYKIVFLKKVIGSVVSITEKQGVKFVDVTDCCTHDIFELSRFGNFSFKVETNGLAIPGVNRVEILYHFSEGHTDSVMDVSFRGEVDLSEVLLKKFNQDERWQHELLRDLRMERIWFFFKKMIRMVFPAIPKPHATRY